MGQRPSDPCDLLDDVEAGDRDRVRAPGQDPPQRAPDVAAPVLGQDRAKRRLRDFGDSTQLTLVGLHPASCCHRQGLLQTHKKKGSELVDLRFGRVAIDEVRARRADAERRGGVAQLARHGPNFLSRDGGSPSTTRHRFLDSAVIFICRTPVSSTCATARPPRRGMSGLSSLSV